MKHSLLIAVVTIGLLTGCSTSNMSTQTPDDVYYSPAAGTPGSPAVQKQQDRYERYMSSNDDRYLAMKVQNYTLWSPLDDYSYWYDSRYNYYNYGYASNWYMMSPYSYYAFNPFYANLFYGNYFGWSIWDNPVYVVATYKNTKVSTYTSGSNITAYRNKNYNNTNSNYVTHKSYNYTVPGNNNNNNANTNSFGSIIRRTFSPGSSSTNNYNNTNSTYTNPVRTYTPSATSSSTPATSSSAGGSSGGYNSTGSSSSGGRGSRTH